MKKWVDPDLTGVICFRCQSSPGSGGSYVISIPYPS